VEVPERDELGEARRVGLMEERGADTSEETLLSLRNLKVDFYTYAGVVKALDGVNLDVREGETLGLVGETGCGKSVTARAVTRLVPPPGKITDGAILYRGENILTKSEAEMRKIRGKKISMVFQDPMTYLNPLYTVGDQIIEVISLHQDLQALLLEARLEEIKNKIRDPNVAEDDKKKLTAQLAELRERPPKFSKNEIKKKALEKAIEALRMVNMPDPEKVANQYPHELSGGMRQRAIIAMALCCNPDLLIADEPTTALDVTIRAQILELIMELKQKLKMSILLITHDMGTVARICDRVAVMYAGNIVELSDTRTLFKNPKHPYTIGLLKSIPKLHKESTELASIVGSVPDLINPPSGCRFHPRCSSVRARCVEEKPQPIEVEPYHFVSCHLYAKSDTFGENR
jgi:oligopeptide/dipeptide ABC transporter ATP-binding protein